MRLKRGNLLVASLSLASLWLFIVILTPTPQTTDKSVYHRSLMEDLNAKRGRTTQPPLDQWGHKKVKMKEGAGNLSKYVAVQSPDEHADGGNYEDPEGRHKILHSIDKRVIKDRIGGGKDGKLHRQNQTERRLLLWEENLIVLQNVTNKYSYSRLWGKAGSWVKDNQIDLPGAPELGSILHTMTTATIMKADVGYKGTQLKARLTLKGGQIVVFKPKWYRRDEVMTGTPYSGKDRHNGEIAAFHLNRVLGFHRAPLVAGRRINLKTEVLPVATEALNATFFTKDNNTCFYGKCYYCRPEDPICGEGDIMEGSLTLWLPQKIALQRWRHPWARTYRKGRKAKWEVNDSYCQQVLADHPIRRERLLLDIVDTAVFDYLMGNADRHMFETIKDSPDPMLLLLDNGKSFGNPYWDEGSILAPIKQCCIIRRSTWETLSRFKDGNPLSDVMRRVLSHDAIAPILNELHLEALDRRMSDIFYTINELDSPWWYVLNQYWQKQSKKESIIT